MALSKLLPEQDYLARLRRPFWLRLVRITRPMKNQCLEGRGTVHDAYSAAYVQRLTTKNRLLAVAGGYTNNVASRMLYTGIDDCGPPPTGDTKTFSAAWRPVS